MIFYAILAFFLGLCFSLLISAWLLVHSYITNRYKRIAISGASSFLLWSSLFFLTSGPVSNYDKAIGYLVILICFWLMFWTLRILLRKSRYSWSPLLADIKTGFDESVAISVMLTNPILLAVFKLYFPLPPPEPWSTLEDRSFQELLAGYLFHSWIMVAIAIFVWLQLGALRSQRMIYMIGWGFAFTVGPLVVLLLLDASQNQSRSMDQIISNEALLMIYIWLLGFMLGIERTNRILPED
jgi:hypothetical protein